MDFSLKHVAYKDRVASRAMRRWKVDYRRLPFRGKGEPVNIDSDT